MRLVLAGLAGSGYPGEATSTGLVLSTSCGVFPACSLGVLVGFRSSGGRTTLRLRPRLCQGDAASRINHNQAAESELLSRDAPRREGGRAACCCNAIPPSSRCRVRSCALRPVRSFVRLSEFFFSYQAAEKSHREVQKHSSLGKQTGSQTVAAARNTVEYCSV